MNTFINRCKEGQGSSFVWAMVCAFVFMSLVGCKSKNTPTYYSNSSSTSTKNYTYYFFDEPCFLWGSGQAVVKSWMAQNGFVFNTSLTQNGYLYLSFNSKRAETMTTTIFDASSGEYIVAAVLIEQSALTEYEMLSFLKERYKLIDSSNLLFRTSDGLTDVELTGQTISGVNYYYVLYSSAY